MTEVRDPDGPGRQAARPWPVSPITPTIGWWRVPENRWENFEPCLCLP